jgi:prevent-host-death family protein
MKYVNTREAGSQLSRLIAEVRAGGKVAICQAGKPVALLTPYEAPRRKPRLVRSKAWWSFGQVRIPRRRMPRSKRCSRWSRGPANLEAAERINYLS